MLRSGEDRREEARARWGVRRRGAAGRAAGGAGGGEVERDWAAWHARHAPRRPATAGLASVRQTAERAGPPAPRACSATRFRPSKTLPRVHYDTSELAGRCDGVYVSVFTCLCGVLGPKNVRGGQRSFTPGLGPSFHGSA